MAGRLELEPDEWDLIERVDKLRGDLMKSVYVFGMGLAKYRNHNAADGQRKSGLSAALKAAKEIDEIGKRYG